MHKVCFAIVLALAAETATAEGVHLNGRVLTAQDGPFLGLGATYMCALRDCKYERARLERELDFLARHGFNYIRILSMVGHNASWDGREIAPVTFTSREGKVVPAWPDYDAQLAELVDLTFDRHGLRVELTLFADAQLMPEAKDRLAHMERVLGVLKGRENKVILLEVANEAWQNGFPGEAGQKQLREFADFLKARTELLVAITCPDSREVDAIRELYRGTRADVATVHFSRDTRGEEGPWQPVRDCWSAALAVGIPVSSNEPIGPGASVASDGDPARLVSAAIFAYMAGLPMYVYHSSAGIRGLESFAATPATASFESLLKTLPKDLPNWSRREGPGDGFPLRMAYRYRADGTKQGERGCIYCPCATQGDRFIAAPMGVPEEGLDIELAEACRIEVFDPFTAKRVVDHKGEVGSRIHLERGPQVYVVQGTLTH